MREPSEQEYATVAESVPFAGEEPKEDVAEDEDVAPCEISPLGETAYVRPEYVSEGGTAHGALHDVQSQEYVAAQAKVHCPAVVE